MSTWVSAAPVIGAGSLDGFAVGALMTGACALAITAPRRSRGRKAAPAREGALAAEQNGWLCEHVMAAEPAGAGVAAEAAEGAGPAALAAVPAPAESGVQVTRRPAAGRGARAAGGYRSRHRLGDPTPGSMPWEAAELVFPDPQPADRAPGSPGRTEARRLPRHAAPSVSFGSRITGLSSRMTGMIAPRALATGARG